MGFSIHLGRQVNTRLRLNWHARWAYLEVRVEGRAEVKQLEFGVMQMN